MSLIEYLIIGLAVLWFAVILWIELNARRIKQTEEKKEVEAAPERPDISVPEILCRFVFNPKGEQVGETIALDEDLVIIKSKDKYYGVPLKHIEEKDGKLTVIGITEWDKAEELAKQWKEKSTKPM